LSQQIERLGRQHDITILAARFGYASRANQCLVSGGKAAVPQKSRDGRVRPRSCENATA
jgi:hypothetical protein